jgi:hypothetical protein
MKKIGIVALVAFVISCVSAQAQNETSSYVTALGIKAWGDGAGITVKHFARPNRALEGIGYFSRGGARFTGLYEFHFDFEGAPGLKWYVGPGVHLGVYNNRYYDNRYYDGNGAGTFVGIDGVLGLDYKFTGAPINLSLDWQPSVELGPNRGFMGSWGGLGIRYTF